MQCWLTFQKFLESSRIIASLGLYQFLGVILSRVIPFESVEYVGGGITSFMVGMIGLGYTAHCEVYVWLSLARWFVLVYDWFFTFMYYV
ncbi:hypothetical protein C1645_155663 [Glomus cerebriforme]|uniref:Uncharacterized protein n=1 Tax=Glomus cerebriforme TaxID=658196 RepID=A0A397SZD0_9GLOM|nr:hypothetical protein C1645_155663 [Glomus cerebriforme]